MGYFSELDYMQYDEREWGSPTQAQQLIDRIDCLKESLVDLENQCPRDMCDPEFDRIFYSECMTDFCDDVHTIQGILQEIRKAENSRWRGLEEKQQCMEQRNTA